MAAMPLSLRPDPPDAHGFPQLCRPAGWTFPRASSRCPVPMAPARPISSRPSRCCRRARPARRAFEELARHGSPRGWAVAAECLPSARRRNSLGTGWTPGRPAKPMGQTPARGRSTAPRKRAPAALADHMRILWLTPAMDRLFAGPAGDRRRFLDRLVAPSIPNMPRASLVFEKAHARAQPPA